MTAHKLDPIFESCQKYEEFLSEQLLSRLHSDVVDFKQKHYYYFPDKQTTKIRRMTPNMGRLPLTLPFPPCPPSLLIIGRHYETVHISI